MRAFLIALAVSTTILSPTKCISQCDATVPTFVVDLTGNPDSVWVSTPVQRQDKCCGVGGSSRCVQFILTLDPDAEAIRFSIASGATPGGSLFWQLNCGGNNNINDEICITGPGPHQITFCKPGNNTNTYAITSIAEPAVSPTTASNDACTGQMWASGFDPATINWTNIDDPALDSLMDCTTCDTVNVSAPFPLLASTRFEVSGTPQGGCSVITQRDTTEVFFFGTLNADIQPKNPTICFGGTTTSVDANASGGKPPYSYLWNNGDTTSTINVGLGTFFVELTDSFACQIVSDTVTVTANPLPVAAHAGNDTISCGNNPDVSLNGSVDISTGGQWINGGGTFNPNDTTLNAVYTPSGPEITAGTATLTLITTGNMGCPQDSDNVIITIAPTPVVDAGPNQTVCGNNAATTLAGSVTNAGGGTWTGGGGTYFPNANTLNAVYTPSAAEITAGTVTLTLTSTGNGTCNPVSDSIIITIDPAPTVGAGVNQTVCANNPDVTLSGTFTISTGIEWLNGGGGYNPSNTDPNAVYTPSGAEITAGSAQLVIRTTGNGICATETDTIDITITPAPTANANVNQTVCANNPDVTLAGSITVATGGSWSGGGGSYNPNNTTLNAVYTPSSAEITAGTATLTLTTTGNGTCNSVTDNMTITITPAPTVDVGANQTVCANNPNVTLSGVITVATGGTWSNGGGSFAPNATTLNATYTPSAGEITGGSAQLILTSTGNGTCTAEDDTLDITITPAPTANANVNQTVCANNPDVTLAGSVTVATGGSWSGGGGSYNPNNATLNAVYTPSAAEITAGTATLTLTTTGNGTCLAVNDAMTITVTGSPTVNAGLNQTVCANNADVTLGATFTVATGIQWSNGAGSYNPNSTDPNAVYTPTAGEITAGSVSLIITTTGNGTCNAVSDTIDITITASPTANAGPDGVVCANNSNSNLNGAVSVATGGQWTSLLGGTFSPNNTVLNPVYTPSAAELAANLSIVVLETTGNGTCISVRDTMLVVIVDSQTVSAGPDQSICENNPVINLAGSNVGATSTLWTSSGGGTSFAPNSNTDNAVYTATAGEVGSGSIVLTYTASKATCNDVSDQMVITFTPTPTVNAGPDQTVCANNPDVSLNGVIGVATGGTWSGGGGSYSPDANTLNATYTPSAAEITAGSAQLILTSTGNGNCAAVTDTIDITITTAPTVNAGTDQSVCANNANTSLNGSITVATGGTWSTSGTGVFSPNSTTLNATYVPSAADTVTGSITLTLTTTGNGNCVAETDNMTLTITPQPGVNAGADVSVCEDNPNVNLNATIATATGGLWTNGAGIYNPGNTTLNAVYTPSVAEITAGSAQLILTSTGNGTCNAVSDTIDITITTAPTVDAGPSQTICGSGVGANLNGIITIATGGSWTSSGSGGFAPNANTLNATYNPSAGDLTQDSIKLVLTTTGNGNCNAYSDSLYIRFETAPSINAGPDETRCTNDHPFMLNGVGSPATWTTSGSGSFSPNANTLNATYTPSPADTIAGTVTLTLSTTVTGTCPSINDQVVFTLPSGPLANANIDSTICADNSSFGLNGSILNAGGATWTTNGTGSFTPNANTLNATYNISTADTAAGSLLFILTTTANGSCPADIDTMVLTITPAVNVSAGPDQTICADLDSVILAGNVITAAGGLWTSSGSGTFSPNDSAITGSYIPSPADTASGSVDLILTSYGNGNCGSDADTMTITINPAPFVNAGVNDTICADSSSYGLNGSISFATGGNWSSTGTGAFSPNSATLNANYIPTAADTAAGSVSLILTSTGNGTCNAVDDTLELEILPQPWVNAGPDQSVCADIGSISLSGTVSNAGGGLWTSSGSGNFNDSTLFNADYNVSSADSSGGVVVLTLTSTSNGICKAVNDQVVYTITTAPTVNAGLDQTLCANSDSAFINGSVTIATGGIWNSDGAGSFTNANSLNSVYLIDPSDSVAGQVKIWLTTTGNGNCNAVTDTLDLTINQQPIVSAGTSDTVCADTGSYSLSGTVMNATGGSWSSSGSGSFSPNNSDLNASYFLSAADSASSSVTLTLTSTGNGPCNAVTDQITLTIDPAPIVDAGTDINACASASTVTLSGNITNATGGVWTSSGSGTFADSSVLGTDYTPSTLDTSAGTVNLTLTSTGNGICKTYTDIVAINFTSAPLIDAGPDQTICGDQTSVNISAGITNAAGVVWTASGPGTFTPDNVSVNTTYNVTNTDTANHQVSIFATSSGTGVCPSITDTLVIFIDTVPVVSAGNDVTVCADSASIALNGQVDFALGGTWTSTGTGTFSPNNVTFSASYIPTSADTAAGSVTLTLTSTGNGLCNAYSDQMDITFDPKPIAIAGADDTICGTSPTYALSGNVANTSSSVWSTSSGLGAFADSTSLTTTFTPDPLQVAAGTVVLRLRANSSGVCATDVDTKILTLQAEPVVDAGLSQTVCVSDTLATLAATVINATGGYWTTSGTGYFVDSTDLNGSYVYSALDSATTITLTLTSTGNGFCGPVQDFINLSFQQLPGVTANDDTLCSDQAGIAVTSSKSNVGSVVWSSSGTGTFSPSTTTQNPTYSPSAGDVGAGQVTLTVTTTGNGNCAAASDSIILGVVPAPQANAGPNQVLCANQNSATLAGSVTGATGGRWSSSGGGNFTPDTSTLNATYSFSAFDISSGSATLTLITTGTGICAADTDQTVITITPSPISTPGADISICADSNNIAISGSVSIATGGVWSSSGTGTFTDSLNLNTTYFPSGADSAAGAVYLRLTTTGNGTCNSETDSLLLNITPAPTLSSGNDDTICADAAGYSMTPTFTVATGGFWATPGTGILTWDSTTFIASYLMNATDTANGSVSFTFTTTGSGNCKEISDSINVVINPAPTVSVGAPAVCASSDTIPLNGSFQVATGIGWTSTGTGTFTPDTFTTTAGYIPSPADQIAGNVRLYLTTTGNGLCNEVVDSLDITISPPPTVSAGVSDTVCADTSGLALSGSFSVAGGIVWTSSGTGTFVDSSDTNTVYIPSFADTAAGSVRLYITTTGNGLCPAIQDSMDLTIFDAPYVDAGPTIICATDTVINLSGLFNATMTAGWTSNGTGTFSDTSDMNSTYTMSPADTTAGTVNIILQSIGENTFCRTVYDTVVINRAIAPVAGAGPGQIICDDRSSITLAGNVTNAGGGVWSTSGTGTFNDSTLLNANYLPSVADTVADTIVLTLTTTGNGICAAVQDTMTLTFTPIPTVDAGPSTVCSNNPAVNISGSITIATGSVWSTAGDGTFADSLMQTTTYNPGPNDIIAGNVNISLTTTGNGDCQAYTDIITLNITAAPTANANVNQTICSNAGIANLSGSVAGATGGVWSSTGTGTFNDSTLLNATYFPSNADTTAGAVTLVLTTTGVGSCIPVTDSMDVTFVQSPVSYAGSDDTICVDSASVGLTGGVSFATGGLWSTTGSGTFVDSTLLSTTYNPVASDTLTGSIFLILTSTGNGSCNADVDSLELFFQTRPTIDAGPGSVCSDQIGFQLNATFTGATGASWSTSGTGTFAPNSIVSNPLYIYTTADSLLGSVTLGVQSTGNGVCTAAKDSIILNIQDPPSVDAGTDQTICANVPGVNLTGSFSGIATGVRWTTIGSGTYSDSLIVNPVYTQSAADTLNGFADLVIETTGNGVCSAAYDTVRINYTPAPTAIVNAGNDTTICANEAFVPLSGFVSIAGGGEWSTTGSGSFTPGVNSLNAQYYPSPADTAAGVIDIVLSTTSNGSCISVQDTMRITVTASPIVIVGPDTTYCADFGAIPLNGQSFIATGGQWSTTGSGTFTPGNTALNATYTPSSGDLTDSVVVLTLISTGNGACTGDADSRVLFFNPVPIVSSGFDQTICADLDSISVSGTVQNATGIQWSSSGSGTFDVDTNLSTTYRVSPGDSAGGSVTIYLTSTGNFNCSAIVDSFTLTITQAVTANAGPDQTICADNASITLAGSVGVASGGAWITDGTGTFSPSQFILNPQYFTTDTDTTNNAVEFILITTGNGTCQPVTDTMNLTLDPAPFVTISTDQTVCADIGSVNVSGTVQVANGVQWTTAGDGNYTPHDSSLTPAYAIGTNDISNGIVNLTMTSTGNGLCNAVSDNLNITITPSPTIEAGPDQTVCGDADSIALSGSFAVATGGLWSSNGSGTFSDPTDPSARYFISSGDSTGGSVTIYFSSTGNGTCIQVIDSMTLTITTVPTVSAGVNHTVCGDTASVGLNGSVTISTGGVWATDGAGSFSPNNSDLNALYVPDSADLITGTINLSLTTTGNGNCQAYTDYSTITFTPIPTVNAGTDDTICADESGSFISGIVTTATGGVWTSSGSGNFITDSAQLNAQYTPSASDITAGLINLTLTTTGNGDCQAYTDSKFIIITPAPTVEAGLDIISCANNSVETLNGSFTTATGVIWSGGSGNYSPNATTASMTYTPTTAEIDTGSVTLYLTTTGNGTCQSYMDSVTITYNPSPIVDAGSGSICADIGQIIPMTGSVTNASGGVWTSSGSGVFSPAASDLNANYNPSAADITNVNVVLTLTSTGNGACLAVSDTLNLIITALPTANAGNDAIICRSDQISLSAQTFPSVSYTWFDLDSVIIDSQSVTTIQANTDTSFVVGVTDLKGCTVFDTVGVFAFDPPALQLLASYCYFDTLTLDANPTPVPTQGVYQWYTGGSVIFGEDTTTLSIPNPGVYVIGHENGNCRVSDTTSVNQPTPVNVDSVVFCEDMDGSVVLDAGPGAVYLWAASGNINRFEPVTTAGWYQVTIFDLQGCQIVDSIEAVDICPPRVFVPTALGPNVPGGENLEIFGQDFTNFKIWIYNRWGELVFHSTDKNVTWDGTFRGKMMPPGVYPWRIEYDGTIDSFKGPFTQEGKVMLVR